MEVSVFEFGNEYICRYYFDIDYQCEGIDVSRDGEHLGKIVALSIPDEQDADEVKKFEKEVIDWLVYNEEI